MRSPLKPAVHHNQNPRNIRTLHRFGSIKKKDLLDNYWRL